LDFLLPLEELAQRLVFRAAEQDVGRALFKSVADFAKAMAGSKLLLLPRLIAAHGLSETLRMLKNVSQATARPVTSLALETYWSRGALLWVDAGPVRYLLRPAPDATPGSQRVKSSRSRSRHTRRSRRQWRCLGRFWVYALGRMLPSTPKGVKAAEFDPGPQKGHKIRPVPQKAQNSIQGRRRRRIQPRAAEGAEFNPGPQKAQIQQVRSGAAVPESSLLLRFR